MMGLYFLFQLAISISGSRKRKEEKIVLIFVNKTIIDLAPHFRIFKSLCNNINFSPLSIVKRN